VLVWGFVWLISFAAHCTELSAQDAIERIEDEYNAWEKDRRLTAVTFRSLKSVLLSSSLIRLGDVVEPVDPDLPGWEQISRLGIGLVPVGGAEMLIERARMEPFIQSGQQHPTLIRWIGPSKIRVCCRIRHAFKEKPAFNEKKVAFTPDSIASHRGPGKPSVSEILRASAASPTEGTGDQAVSESRRERSVDTVDPKHLQKLQRWIRTGYAVSVSGGLDLYDFRIVEVEKIRPTQRNLDLAILGKGFLQVLDPTTGGRVCVPAGKLDVDVNGDLVVANDRLIMPLHPTVNIPSDTVHVRIKSDGLVKVQRSGLEEWEAVGKLLVSTSGQPVDQRHGSETVALANADGSVGTSAIADIHASWQVLQGFLEASSREAYQDFESITGIETVSGLHGLRNGICKFRIQGRGLDGPVDLIVSLELDAKPVVAAPRKSFPRGHRLTLQDLHLIPIDVDQVDEKQFDSLRQLVGLEVSKSLRVNRPIVKSDVRQPTLVRRGDLLDLRVVGAGVVVTTSAKALDDGPLDGLIEVETMRPRKRKIARVVSAGVVEILSRPPQVSNLLETRRK
jgi:flagella basal body P-ring formation protein FlgA